MLRPIPAKILRTSANVRFCTGVDRYQNPAYEEETVTKVHLQPTNEARKTASDAEVLLRSILFVDARRSRPAMDWEGLFRQAQAAGGDMRVTVRDVEYTVASVDALRDDTDRLHHWEIGLV